MEVIILIGVGAFLISIAIAALSIVYSFGLFVIMIGLHIRLKTVMCTSTKKLNGKTVLITGGSRGIGMEVAMDLARRGANVVITSEIQEEGLCALDTIIETSGSKLVSFRLLDLASLESVRMFAEDFLRTEPRLDILINNAGTMRPDTLTEDGMNHIMQVNYFGQFLLTHLLLPLLKKSGSDSEPSRIVINTSMSHAYGEVNFDTMNTAGRRFGVPFISYKNSKLCITMFTRELSKRIENTNVVVNTADPNFVVTRIGEGFAGDFLFDIYELLFGRFFPTAWDGAQTVLHVVLDDKAGQVSGEYFKYCQLSKADDKVYNDVISQKLWNKAVHLVKLSDNEIEGSFR